MKTEWPASCIVGIVAITGVIVAAPHRVASDASPAPLPAPVGSDSGQELIAVPPPPFSEGIFPCSTCHTEDVEVNTTRRNVITMNIGAVFIYLSVYIEKGIALIIPGYTPDTLGQIYRYTPSSTEVRVAIGIFGTGFLLFTILVKVANHLIFGPTRPAHEAAAAAGDLPGTAATHA